MVHDKALLTRLSRAVREFPRYNQFVVKAHDTSLSLIESHILVESHADKYLAQKELAERLHLGKVQLSKIIKKLLANELITLQADKHDRRQKYIRLSPLGIKTLKQFDSQANQRLEGFVKNADLGKKDIEALADFLSRFAIALSGAPFEARKQEHPLRAPIRQLTRSFGLLGGAALGTNLNVLEWQLLLSIGEYSGHLTPSMLANSFSAERSIVSLALKSLLNQRLISKEAKASDTRSSYLSCTRKGFGVISKVEASAVSSFSTYRNLASSDLNLLEKFIRGAALDFFVSREGLTVQSLLTSADIHVARERFVASYLKNKLPLPGVLFAESNSNWGLFRGERLVAALSYDKRSKGVVNLMLDDGLHFDAARGFLLKALKHPLDQDYRIKSDSPAACLVPSSEVSSTLGRLFTLKN
ncbi:MAG: MarR family transcriptional regulator [Bdellovibrionales bacterium]|nr:MarR family transcriptional regulator [Bdellovibrionales bacterium]